MTLRWVNASMTQLPLVRTIVGTKIALPLWRFRCRTLVGALSFPFLLGIFFLPGTFLLPGFLLLLLLLLLQLLFPLLLVFLELLFLLFRLFLELLSLLGCWRTRHVISRQRRQNEKKRQDRTPDCLHVRILPQMTAGAICLFAGKRKEKQQDECYFAQRTQFKY